MTYDPSNLVIAMHEAKAIVGDTVPHEFLESAKKDGSVKTVLEDMIQLIGLSTGSSDHIMIATVDVRVAASFAEPAMILSILAAVAGKRRVSITIRQLYLTIIQSKLTSDENSVMLTTRLNNKRALVVCLKELSHYINRLGKK